MNYLQQLFLIILKIWKTIVGNKFINDLNPSYNMFTFKAYLH